MGSSYNFVFFPETFRNVAYEEKPDFLRDGDSEWERLIFQTFRENKLVILQRDQMFEKSFDKALLKLC